MDSYERRTELWKKMCIRDSYMSDTLDEEWNKLRGMEIQAVGIASISYDEESQKLINLRNKGAMMGDPLVREGYVQSTIAEGLKNAGGNANGALAGFMGMGMGMQSSGSFMGAASNTNMAQMQMNQMPGGQWQGACLLYTSEFPTISHEKSKENHSIL